MIWEIISVSGDAIMEWKRGEGEKGRRGIGEKGRRKKTVGGTGEN